MVCISVKGRLDTTTAPELDEIVQGLNVDDFDGVEFDFDELEYISSAGLRVLLSTEKKFTKKNGATVINVNDDVKEIFEITGFDNILKMK